MKIVLFFSLAGLTAWSFAFMFDETIGVGIGMMILIFVHECGHILALRDLNKKHSMPVPLPWLGAILVVPDFDTFTREDEAYVAYAGPLLGSISSMIIATPYCFTGNELWLKLSITGLVLDLGNLLGILPLDGGRILHAVHVRFAWVGYIVAAIVCVFGSVVFGLVLLLLALILRTHVWHDKRPYPSSRQRIIFLSAWLALILFQTSCIYFLYRFL